MIDSKIYGEEKCDSREKSKTSRVGLRSLLLWMYGYKSIIGVLHFLNGKLDLLVRNLVKSS